MSNSLCNNSERETIVEIMKVVVFKPRLKKFLWWIYFEDNLLILLIT